MARCLDALEGPIHPSDHRDLVYLVSSRPRQPAPPSSLPPRQQTPALSSSSPHQQNPAPPSPAPHQQAPAPPSSPPRQQTLAPSSSPPRQQTPAPPSQAPRQPSPPPKQQGKRGVTATTASGTTGGKRYKVGPSLKPVPRLPYHLTEEENKAEVAAQVQAHFGPKSPPPPEEKVPEHVMQHNIDMVQPLAAKHRDSDYERQIKKVISSTKKEGLELELEPRSCQKSGKNVPQLGEQAV
ncbi:vegetative cell wall protein gp1-like [Triticum urartu]|uniref:vegetative cell wall protein gp1-like n=1 Tax=Triticum urartu TaxID=4572 RepID=UPI0020430976|nr:vegetative cell wall protein gp1-like [Triticum urartu]